ncbi:MAG: hypothetical protein GYB49_13330 [Alphaproteobacteria bacterium]|nr:hypothetical protein [Hyphomonas sp.]MBR9808193.1 hypothetical protein [Alphaproteobacteria bacterium]
MGIFASVIALCMGRKPGKASTEPPETYARMTPAELKQAALSGDHKAEVELRRRADAADK